jgi:hypothetical protein
LQQESSFGVPDSKIYQANFLYLDYQFLASLGVAVIPPTYGGVSRQNALFAPKYGKITAIPREPVFKVQKSSYNLL